MLVSSQTDALAARFGDVKAIQLLAEAGFDAFDLSLFRMMSDDNYEMNQPDYRQYAAMLRKVADKAGIICNQAHAPFHSSTEDPDETAVIFTKIVRSMEAASIVGAKNIIVHPKQHLRYISNEEALKQMNLEFYRALVPYAQEFGIRVAVENMWQYEVDHITHSTCSHPEEFCEYVDQVGSDWIVACLDVGHASLVDVDLPTMIHALGQKRLQALHVHDTDFIHDLHTLPFMAKIDYNAVTKALADIGYQGDMTFEADHFFDHIPNEMIPAAARFMCQTGRYLASKARHQQS